MCSWYVESGGESDESDERDGKVHSRKRRGSMRGAEWWGWVDRLCLVRGWYLIFYFLPSRST